MVSLADYQKSYHVPKGVPNCLMWLYIGVIPGERPNPQAPMGHGTSVGKPRLRNPRSQMRHKKASDLDGGEGATAVLRYLTTLPGRFSTKPGRSWQLD